ncbi:MAG TPA: hypothetical protein VIK89_04440 [Cytophagaceae bacterium]
MKYQLITDEIKINTNDIIKKPSGELFKVVGLSVSNSGFLDDQNFYITPYPVEFTYTIVDKKIPINKVILINDQWEKRLA